jgi:tetratricopeptide (TPR) repeat protein
MDHSPSDNRIVRPAWTASARALRWLAVLVPVLSLAAGVLYLVRVQTRTGAIGIPDIAVALLLVFAGLVGGGLLYGTFAALRLLRDLKDLSLLAQHTGLEPSAPHGAAAHHSDPPTRLIALGVGEHKSAEGAKLSEMPWPELLRLLEDIRDNSLLTEAERADKRRRVANDELEDAQAAVWGLSAKGDFVQARQLAEKMQRKYPQDERAAPLVKQVETARARREAEDVGAAGRQVDDLISISAWQRARDLAQQLQDRHPDSVEARQLLLRVERDHAAFEDEQRRRMHAEIQRCVSRRCWDEALAAARLFIERFPGCEESAGLLMELPTLEGNAEIEVRQKLEARIMDCAKHGRYIEAVDLARKVIEKYPSSPQADALRAQLPRLEELADDPSAPPARLKMDE